MKILCECGSLIRDQTDFLSYKAHLIADQDITDALELSDKGSSSWWHSLSRMMYQCGECGRLWINDHDNELRSFVPEQPAPHLLSSIHGDKWKRLIRGFWSDTTIGRPKGLLTWGHLSNEDYEMFDDWDAMSVCYQRVFERLRDQGILRDALLRKNGETIHYWELEK